MTKKQTSVAEKQYRSFDKALNMMKKKEPVTIKKERSEINDKSNLIHDSKYSFIE